MNTKITHIIIFFLVNIPAIFSQTEYFEYNLPTEEDLALVDFFDYKNGIIVTENGQVFYTNNMAKKWVDADLGIDYKPKKLIYSKSGEAVIIGSKSTILKSYNYGRDWIVLSHDEGSDLVYNFIISRNANDYYLTTEGTKDIYYSYDGLHNIEKVNTMNLHRSFRSYPLVYSYKRSTIILAGLEDYKTDDYVNYYHFFGVFKSNNCNYFNRMYLGVNTPAKPRLNSFDANDLVEIDEQIIKISDYSINFYDHHFYDGPDYYRSFILRSLDSIRKVRKTGDNSFVVLLDSALILNYENVSHSNFGPHLLEYELDTIDINNKDNFDYETINDSLSIIISNNGKYFLSFDKEKTKIPEEEIEEEDRVIKYDINNINTFSNFFPNPTNDIATIVFDEEIYVNTIQVFSIEGYLLFENKVMKKDKLFEVNLKGLQSSTYHIKLIGEKKKFIYKNIIKF